MHRLARCAYYFRHPAPVNYVWRAWAQLAEVKRAIADEQVAPPPQTGQAGETLTVVNY